MSDILSRIAAYKRDEVAARRAKISDTELDFRVETQGPPRGFAASLRARANASPAGLALIAVKGRHPGRLRSSSSGASL